MMSGGRNRGRGITGMSMGYGAYAHLVEADDKLVLYTYCCYDVDHCDHRRFKETEDGELYIDRDVFIEPEIHEKTVRTASGRKKTVIKRIKQDVPLKQLLEGRKIKVKNASGTWQTAETGEDIMALKILMKLLEEYQEKGNLPEMINLYF